MILSCNHNFTKNSFLQTRKLRPNAPFVASDLAIRSLSHPHSLLLGSPFAAFQTVLPSIFSAKQRFFRHKKQSIGEQGNQNQQLPFRNSLNNKTLHFSSFFSPKSSCYTKTDKRQAKTDVIKVSSSTPFAYPPILFYHTETSGQSSMLKGSA